MKELIEIRDILKQNLENAEIDHRIYERRKDYHKSRYYLGELTAFSVVIDMLENRLNNSCVKPHERRSPTDESFIGCKPPERKAKSTTEILACACLYRNEKGKRILEQLCEKCKQEFFNS